MSLSYEVTNWENGKTVLKAEHLRKIEKGITDIISENDAIYKDEDIRKSNEKQRQEEHSRKMNEVSGVVSDIQKDYDSLQKIIIDENASANLQNQINQTNSQLEHKANNEYINLNDEVAKTFTNGFDFNLVYEIDRSKLNIGKNSIQIKATSQENLVGYANLEASKTKYNLPPIGTKVIIGGIEYNISNASEDGSNQTYTLNTNLINKVKKGDTVQVTQDLVKVLCSMSTLENVKDYKEMKLVKTKKLKGDLEGYVEEKYELQGEGRYSNIKLEMQRFNNNVSTEVLELQQYFDYIVD